MESIYKVTIHNQTGGLVADLTGLELTKQVTRTRNDSDELHCTFSLDKIRDYSSTLGSNVKTIFSNSRNELRISKNGHVVGAGQIISSDRNIDANTREISVSAIGWFGLLARGLTDQALDYSAGVTDGGAIAVALINNIQAQTYGSLGITIGTIQTSNTQVVSYDPGKCVKDAISELSQMEGSFDFEVTWDKVFNIYYPGIGATRPEIPLIYPGNIKKFRLTEDGTKLANLIIAQGQGTGTNKLTAYGVNTISQQVYGLRTRIFNYSDIPNMTMLQSRADADAVYYGAPISIPEIVLDGTLGPDVTQLTIGDRLSCIAINEDGLEDFNNYFRLESYTWAVDASNMEELRLVLAS